MGPMVRKSETMCLSRTKGVWGVRSVSHVGVPIGVLGRPIGDMKMEVIHLGISSSSQVADLADCPWASD